MSQPPLPLFFRAVVPLDATAHEDWRITRTGRHDFAAGTNAIPISLVEFDKVAAHYPIVFAGPEPMPVALVGIKDGENLLVDAAGRWRPGHYLPAYVRTFPFLFIQDGVAGPLYLGMDPTTPLVTAGAGSGDPLFRKGKPSRPLEEIIEVCSAYRDDMIRTRAFSRAIAEAGLLEEKRAVLNFTRGGSARLDGFKVVAEAAVERLPDRRLVEWHHQGWLKPLYACLLAAERWSFLMDLTVERRHDRG